MELKIRWFASRDLDMTPGWSLQVGDLLYSRYIGLASINIDYKIKQ